MTNDRASQEVFFISRIGAPGSEIRFISDIVLHSIVKPAAIQAGFGGAVRADEIERPGRITDEVINRIAFGPAVVADLTGRNPNVFYEVAIAHGARVPLVQLVEEWEVSDLPFDISDQRTVTYLQGDFDSYRAAAERVATQLVAVVADPSLVDNPVTTATRFRALEQAAGAGDADAAVMIMLERIEKRLSSLESASAGEVEWRARGVSEPLSVSDSAGDIAAVQLTAREREVMQLLARGLSHREVADALGISWRTAQVHAANAYSKLEAKTRLVAVDRARSLGLIDPSYSQTHSSSPTHSPGSISSESHTHSVEASSLDSHSHSATGSMDPR